MGGSRYLILDESGEKRPIVWFYSLCVYTLIHLPLSLSFTTKEEEISLILAQMKTDHTIRLDALKDLYRLHLDRLSSLTFF